jgi:hypothetical protein
MGSRKVALSRIHISHAVAMCLFWYIPDHNAHMGTFLSSAMEMLPLLSHYQLMLPTSH